MKKALIKSTCFVCAAIMIALTLFSCTADQDNNNAPSNLHTVTFNSNGGTYISEVEVHHGQKIAEPPAPTRENYIFLYWEHNNRRWIFTTKEITEDITLSALWIPATDLFKTVPTEDPDEILISGFASQKSVHVLNIPEKINGKTVVGFTDNAFERIHEEHADHLLIPATVRSVGEASFKNITNVHIEFGGTISELGISSFEGCTNIHSLKLGAGLKTIPYRCFFGASSLITIDIPEGVTVIEEDAFASCTAMQTIVLPSTLTTIENSAFLDASSIAAIFFKGTEEQFDAIDISDNNDIMLSAKVFFYSETQPTENGDFWHYDRSNTPVLWQ